jgi:hypothetical protein
MQKPFIFLPMWLCEFEELVETIFVANPEIAHGTLFCEFEFPQRVGIEAWSTYGRKLPPIRCNC